MTTITSIYITDEDKRNIDELTRASPGVPLSHLIREMVAKEADLVRARINANPQTR